MKNPFEFFNKKKESPLNKLFLPEIKGEMKKEIGMVQVEYDMANNSGHDDLKKVIKESLERSLEGGRAKIVLSYPISKSEFENLKNKKGREGAKNDFQNILMNKLKNKENILIERIPGELPEYLNSDEYYEITEKISGVDKKFMWVMVFDNTEDEVINPGNLKMVYSHR